MLRVILVYSEMHTVVVYVTGTLLRLLSDQPTKPMPSLTSTPRWSKEPSRAVGVASWLFELRKTTTRHTK